MKKTYFFGALFLLIMFLTSFSVKSYLQPNTYSVERDITLWEAIPQNCSMVFTNIRTNLSLNASCNNCWCTSSLEDIQTKEGDIINEKGCAESICINSKFIANKSFDKQPFKIEPTECKPNYEIKIYYNSVKNENLNELSYSQDLSNLKEGDFLKIKWMSIQNKNPLNCNLGGWEILFSITNPKNITTSYGSFFGLENSFPIPPLNENDTFWIISEKESYIVRQGNLNYELFNYTYFINNNHTKTQGFSGVYSMDSEGEYKIYAQLYRPNSYFSDTTDPNRDRIYTLFLTTSNKLINPSFKVTSRLDHIVMEFTTKTAKLTLILVCLTVLILFFTALQLTNQKYGGYKMGGISQKNQRILDFIDTFDRNKETQVNLMIDYIKEKKEDIRFSLGQFLTHNLSVALLVPTLAMGLLSVAFKNIRLMVLGGIWIVLIGIIFYTWIHPSIKEAGGMAEILDSKLIEAYNRLKNTPHKSKGKQR